jgi:small subunit ribosomal protein S21
MVEAPPLLDTSTVEFEKEYGVQVFVRDNNVEQALKALKRKMQREGVFREMKLRKHYEKPSERKARERVCCRQRNLG